MKRTHLLAALVCLIAMGIFAADTSAMYNPSTGTFMQRDPGAGGATRTGVGGPVPVAGGFIPQDQYGDGMNLYQYVRGNPVRSVDPQGLYEIDVHYTMTYWLASKIPCFTSEEAKQIAEFDQGTDSGATAPNAGVTAEGRHINRMYHRLGIIEDDEITQKDYLSELWAEATFRITHQLSVRTGGMEPHEQRNCSLPALGTYLHSVQDSFSHAGLDALGHAGLLHKPDKTANDYDKAAQMAGRTWADLLEWVRLCRCECYESKIKGKELFVAPMGEQLGKFLKASGGPNIRGINEEELKAKQSILGISP